MTTNNEESLKQPTAEEFANFLRGTAPLHGYWFGERPAGQGPFWWRKYLPILAEQPQPAPMQDSEALEADLAAIRDLLPVPGVGSPLEQAWGAAMSDPREVVGYVRAALASRAEHTVPDVPEGYVLVPTRATDEMRMYGQSAYDHAMATMQAHANRTGAIATAYATMITAAPSNKEVER